MATCFEPMIYFSKTHVSSKVTIWYTHAHACRLELWNEAGGAPDWAWSLKPHIHIIIKMILGHKLRKAACVWVGPLTAERWPTVTLDSEGPGLKGKGNFPVQQCTEPQTYVANASASRIFLKKPSVFTSTQMQSAWSLKHSYLLKFGRSYLIFIVLIFVR